MTASHLPSPGLTPPSKLPEEIAPRILEDPFRLLTNVGQILMNFVGIFAPAGSDLGIILPRFRVLVDD